MQFLIIKKNVRVLINVRKTQLKVIFPNTYILKIIRFT